VNSSENPELQEASEVSVEEEAVGTGLVDPPKCGISEWSRVNSPVMMAATIIAAAPMSATITSVFKRREFFACGNSFAPFLQTIKF